MKPFAEESLYRSRRRAIEDRIAALEGELAGARADLSGLPSPWRRRGLRLASGVALLAAAASALAVTHRRIETLPVTSMLHSGGFALTVQLPGPARCEGALLKPSSGPSERVDCVTRPDDPALASIGLTLDQARGPLTLRVDYERAGAEHHATLVFDPGAARTESAESALAMVPEWVVVDDRLGRRLLYFTTLLTYANALREIRYGFDDGPLDRRVRFAKRERLGVERGDELYTELPPEVRAVSVEVVFDDGSTSRRSFTAHRM